MLGDLKETPTRYELLNMVKKHSKLLGKTIVNEDDASNVEINPCFWHDVMDLYFIRGRETRGREDDDLVFFVRKISLHGYSFNDKMGGNSPYFVRRWAPKLDDLVDGNSADVDWRRSFYLNFIVHTSFSITVAICSHQVLRNHKTGQDTSLSSIYKVVKTVYASPSHVDFHLDSRKEEKTTPAYPDICFAVDDFDSTFDEVVLKDADHCYCALLNADGGAAFPNEREDCSSSDISFLKINTSCAKSKKSKLTLFSGFVSYLMVRDAYEAGKSGFRTLFSLARSPRKTDRIYMKGPGGHGEVEVAVSGATDLSKRDSGRSSLAFTRGFSIGKIVRTVASVVSVAAKKAHTTAASTQGSDEAMLPLKCCLISISLPWEHIAYALLFKGSPSVNL